MATTIGSANPVASQASDTELAMYQKALEMVL